MKNKDAVSCLLGVGGFFSVLAIAQFRLQINKKKTNLFRKFVTL